MSRSFTLTLALPLVMGILFGPSAVLAAATRSYAGGYGRAQASESAAAADVVRVYYRALAARDYRTAYALWGGGGAASGKSLAAFSQGFAQTRATSVHIVSVGAPEGAAGSLFVTIAVEVDATLNSGARQHFAGTYALRRVDQVPGASADQLRWHIQSASLHATMPQAVSEARRS